MTEEERENAVTELCSKMMDFTVALDKGDPDTDYSMPGVENLVKAIVASDLLPDALIGEFKGIIRELEFARMTAAIAVVSLLSSDLDEVMNSSQVIHGISKRAATFSEILSTAVRQVGAIDKQEEEAKGNLH